MCTTVIFSMWFSTNRFANVLPLAFVIGALAILGVCFFAGAALFAEPARQNNAAAVSDRTAPEADRLTASLRALVDEQQLRGAPSDARDLEPVKPDQDSVVKLGQLLFFSHTLSGNLDSSCASCHHPHFGGSDGLSLSVGVAPQDPSIVGPERIVDPGRDGDPAADGGPNIPRNSPTIFNSAFFDRALTYDGRIAVTERAVAPGGQGQPITTPETGNGTDNSDADTLLEVQAKSPLAAHDEMRAYRSSGVENPDEYRRQLVARLRGERSQALLSQDGPKNWRRRFKAAFGSSKNDSGNNLITLIRVQKALAAYEQSMTFVDTPWKSFVQGDDDAISSAAKRGALKFYKSFDEGGLACDSCHSGDFFTDENFYNIGFPQIGRGFQQSRNRDLGRWMQTRKPEHRYAFRTPTLLNIAKTAPYGHAGTFETLEQLLQYHANPSDQVGNYDFSLDSLPQFDDLPVEYPAAEKNTRAALGASSFQRIQNRLPGRHLTTDEVSDLKAFLNTLTDRCVDNSDCRSAWIPAPQEDPDGNMLVRGENPDRAERDSVPEMDNQQDRVALETPTQAPRSTFKELKHCERNPTTPNNTGSKEFKRTDRDPEFGMANGDGTPRHPHGFTLSTWGATSPDVKTEPTMMAGGVTAAYLNDDCWLDLVYTGGEKSGLVFYENEGKNKGFSTLSLLSDNPGGLFTGSAVTDLNGDYRKEILFGNLLPGAVPVYAPDEEGVYHPAAQLSMTRHTFGMSFGDYNNDGYPDFYLAHWGGNTGTAATAPVLWKNNKGKNLQPIDQTAKTSPDHIGQTFNFTPAFADLNQDGHQDLLVASDFNTSLVLRNTGNGSFKNVTDRDVITDENGMGSALGDFDNDGDQDWFVSSVFDSDGKAEGNWGVTGNRLYENTSSSSGISFKDVTKEAGVEDGGFAWGSCFADFNNDGWLDIFSVNGIGHIPEYVINNADSEGFGDAYVGITDEFRNQPPALFINQGDGTFKRRTQEWQLDVPSEGRGITCLDYDRDGDMDISLLDHSTGLQFFSNQIGHGESDRFLNIRMVGEPPNTGALGAKIEAVAEIKKGENLQRQTRFIQGNSNFNGQSPPNSHFGMGDAKTVKELTITWPDQTRWECTAIHTNQFLVFDKRAPEDYDQCAIDSG